MTTSTIDPAPTDHATKFKVGDIVMSTYNSQDAQVQRMITQIARDHKCISGVLIWADGGTGYSVTGELPKPIEGVDASWFQHVTPEAVKASSPPSPISNVEQELIREVLNRASDLEKAALEWYRKGPKSQTKDLPFGASSHMGTAVVFINEAVEKLSGLAK